MFCSPGLFSYEGSPRYFLPWGEFKQRPPTAFQLTCLTPNITARKSPWFGSHLLAFPSPLLPLPPVRETLPPVPPLGRCLNFGNGNLFHPGFCTARLPNPRHLRVKPVCSPFPLSTMPDPFLLTLRPLPKVDPKLSLRPS